MTYNSSRRFKRCIDENGCFTQYCVYFCPICDMECESTNEFSDHLASPHHAFRWCLDKFEKKRKSLIKERHGICIEVTSKHDVDYHRFKGLMNAKMLPFKPFEMTMEVVNLRPGVGEGGGGGGPKIQKGRYGLGGGGQRGVVILHRVVSLIEGPVLRDSKNSENMLETPKELAQGSVYRLTAKTEGMDVSCYRFPILFILQMKGSNKYFYIIRELVLKVSSGEELGPPPVLPEESPYKGLDWGFVTGTHEALCPDGRVIRRLNDYLIPITLLPMFKSKLRMNDVMLPEARDSLNDLMELIEDGVNQENYARYFHMLLYHQEFGEQEQIEKFNMTGVSLALGEGDSLELEVPGLEEKRPSVLKNDLIYLKLRFGDNDDEVCQDQFEGKVTGVKQKTLCFESGNGLSSLVIPGARFDVRFGLNRFPLIIMHRAVDGMVEQDLMDFVFPSGEYAERTNNKELPKLSFFNKNIEENPEQKQAVINILLGSSMPAPYIVFGPPGTGKTITIVEAILQVLTVCGDSFMLVCTPSNAACDLVTEMLLRYCNHQLITRLHSRSRDIKSISSAIIKCSSIVNDEIVDPDYEKLKKYRIICCTLIFAGKLAMGKLPRDHITHVFIDECGQAVEPEAVAAVAGLLGFRTATIGKASQNGMVDDDDDPENKGCLVLAGDPLQLGPVIASMDIGLGLSLLERLMTRCILYQRQGESYNPKFITKLVRNFRSHPDILLLPNQLFYENELEAHSQAVLNDPLCYCFPVQFHGVVGGDEREGSSPSYFNMREVEVVIAYVRRLLSMSNGGTVQQSEIGVLTPYTRQVYKLKQALEKKGWTDVEVGSTEVYQGREKRVMIISTVRSAPNAILVEGMYKLGFLSNPKRFNVAITRAQARLIVVGDPYVLSRDQNWMAVIDIAKKNSTYFGARFIPRDEKFISRLHPLLEGVTAVDAS